ncbi:hypothetical protein [Tropicimonas sp. S265A]|uniref:hypothetical protein n=1 Tax=Tropicimonas sp. S265A TaxID=3415134 RepID=UPI003C7DA71F
MTPISIAAVLGIFLLVVFFATGMGRFTPNPSYSNYFLASRSVDKSTNSASYIARFTSLATVLGFFLIFSRFDGLFLLVAPITVFLGIYIFVWIMRRYIFLRDDAGQPFSSMSAMVGDFYGSTTIGRIASSISIFTVFCILLIELYVGVQILSLFIEDTDPLIPISMIIISIPVFLYVCAGGLETVVVTDKLQSSLMWLFVIALLVYVLATGSLTVEKALPRPAISEGVFLLPYALLANIMVVNIFLFPTLYSTWQMRFASQSDDDFVAGTMRGALGVTFLWFALVLCGIGLGSFLPGEVMSIAELAQALANAEDFLVKWLLFPLFFAASLSALFSTADSAIVPIVQSCYDIARKRERSFSRLLAISLTIVLLIVCIFVYILVFGILNYNFINFLFSVFAFAISIAPIILWMFLYPKDPFSKSRANFFALFAVLGFIVALAVSSYGNLLSNAALVQLSAPIALLVALLGPGISMLVHGSGNARD